jgi:hypothetical protein
LEGKDPNFIFQTEELKKDHPYNGEVVIYQSHLADNKFFAFWEANGVIMHSEIMSTSRIAESLQSREKRKESSQSCLNVKNRPFEF